MKLNHLDLQVLDVQRSVLFFERGFGLQMKSNRRSPAIAIMSDGEGFTLVLQKRQNESEPYPEGFHLGFFVESDALVHEFHALARELKLDTSEIISNNRGVMVYCRTPDGIVVEVSCQRARE